jgi:putative Holliday junction resolvase
MAPKTNATVLAFDFGTQKIGIAVGNTLIRFAQPLMTIAADPATMMAMIGALVSEWQPVELVVGLPVHADGSPHRMTEKAKRFAADLRTRFALPVALVDERWTTQAAQDRLNERRRGRAGRSERDAVAAQLILQAYFDERRDSADS